LIKQKGEKTEITKIRNETGAITTDLTEIKDYRGYKNS
jgi:hypothetical protein